MLLTLFCSHCIRFLSFSTDEQSFLSQKSPCPQHTKSTWATASSARQSAHDTAAPPGWQHRLPGGAEEDRSLVSGSDSAELRTMAQWAPSFKTGFAQWWSDGRAVDRLWVWVLAGVVGGVSSPASAFCADCYFGSHSTPVLPTVAWERSGSFCQKRRWQVTAQQAWTLPVWLLQEVTL